MKLFHVCTVSNDLQQYAAMRESFQKGGFDDALCDYTLFDNSRGNAHEPFAAYNLCRNRTRAQYQIFCHQDVRLSKGHGCKTLLRALDELTDIDPRWAVAGNAGVNSRYNYVARITDPRPTANWPGTLPQRVCVLDENFLVLNNAAPIGWSRDLSGFHFYGPDICLHAMRAGRTAYVIDFHLEHLGRGTLDREFWAIKTAFQERWQTYFHFTLLMTPTGVPVLLTRHRWLRKLFEIPAIQRRLLRPQMREIAHLCRLAPRARRPARSVVPA